MSEIRHIWIRRGEWIMAAGMTAVIAVVHVANMRRAGGLWRDEAAAVNLAQMPSLAEIWEHLEHESFPLFFTMLLRSWSAAGLGESDLALRAFGLVVGLAVVGVLWWNAWRFSSGPPLISLLLFGLSPIAIRWGDSLRAYGLGVLCILLTLGTIWQVARSPSLRNVLLAALSAMLAVQSLYQNAFLVAAICLGGAVVAVRAGGLRRALLVISAGIPAAISLLPYLGVARRASAWNMATQIPIDLQRIWLVLHRALSNPGRVMFWLWVVLLVTALVIGCILIANRKQTPAVKENGEMACFFITIVPAVTIAYYIFLKLVKFPSESWYYLVWMAIIVVAIDALVARITIGDRLRLLRLVSAGILFAALIPGVWQRTFERMTNLDLVAQRLNEAAQENDFVLVHPWFCGVTFDRYYKGRAVWTTLPPLADVRQQRLDLFKEQMQQVGPVRPVLEKIEAALRGGHTLWLVGNYPFSNPPNPPPAMPRAGEGPEGWRAAPYMMAYGMEVAYVLQYHVSESALVGVPVATPVNPFENLPVTAVKGWR